MRLTHERNRLDVEIKDNLSAADELNLLMNSFEIYHMMITSLIKSELPGIYDIETLRSWTDGCDGLVDSLRARAIKIDEYLVQNS